MSLYVIKPITIFVSSIFYLLMTITVYIDNELVLAQYLVEIDAYKSAICRVIPHAIHVGTHVVTTIFPTLPGWEPGRPGS